MRKNLKLFRVAHNLTQEEIADKIGFARATYSAIEKGRRNGKQPFWESLQKTFKIPATEMWELMKCE